MNSSTNNSVLETDILEKFTNNLRIDPSWAFVFIICYSCLIIYGSAGNLLVIIAVARKSRMRTVRNVFIVNLAASDLLLCIFTMPLTLIEILCTYWPFGDDPFLCKMTGTLQATSIFVSTLTITAIAIDRHQLIVYPTRRSIHMVGAVLVVSGIWILSMILSLPNFIFRTLATHTINLPGLQEISYCFEDWPHQYGRAYYTGFVILVQYCLPIITVVTAYTRVGRRLRYRIRVNSIKKRTQETDNGRMHKTNKLLLSITLLFCLSWLPLNLYNIIADTIYPFGDNVNKALILYATCHIVGMSSACTNPVLYGWLNDQFRNEFFEMLSSVLPCRKKEIHGANSFPKPRQSHISGVCANRKDVKSSGSEENLRGSSKADTPLEKTESQQFRGSFPEKEITVDSNTGFTKDTSV